MKQALTGIYIAISMSVVQNACAQEIVVEGNYYGLNYENGVSYAPVFSKIESKGFFYFGKKDGLYYNLSRNKLNSEKGYKKFQFHLLDRLLIVGKTAYGEIDLFDETGQFCYMEDGDYNRVIAGKQNMTYQNDDLLITIKNGNKGLYNWVKKEEVLPAKFNKIKVHESCMKKGYFLFVQRKGVNQIINDNGRELLSFKARVVSDMYPTKNCKGYLLISGIKKGYCSRLNKDRFFLIKPRYDDVLFFSDYPHVIIVEKNEKFGLYYHNKRYLKPKYSSIDLLDDPYVLAKVKRGTKEFKLMRSGEMRD